MKIQNRKLLIIALLATEFVMLAVGIFAAGRWMRRSMRENVAEQAIADNELIAGQIGRCIDSMYLKNIDRTTPGWARLQKLTSEIRLPNDGFVCVTDSETGRLICHPDIINNAENGDDDPRPICLGNRRRVWLNC